MVNNSKKNILFFQNSISPDEGGGLPRVSDIVSKELSKRGYKCFFIFYQIDNKHYPQSVKLKVSQNKPYKEFKESIVKFVNDNEINYFIGQQIYDAYFIRIYKDLRNIFPKYPFVFFLHANPDFWLLKYQPGIGLLHSKSILNSTKKIIKRIVYPFYNPYIRRMRTIYGICDKFIVLSDSYKETFIKLYTINDNKNKLHTIRNPLTFKEYASPHEIATKDKIVLIVSRLEESQKKISLALKIWQLVTKNDLTGWKLHIVGTGPDENYYKKIVANKRLINVEFFGKKTNVLEYYKKASIFLMTSIWEGLPMSLLEAQQNGVVPIAFNTFSAIYDLIIDNENGFIIDNSNISDFARKLTALMKDDNLRMNMALKSIEWSEHFHVSKVVDNWEEILD